MSGVGWGAKETAGSHGNVNGGLGMEKIVERERVRGSERGGKKKKEVHMRSRGEQRGARVAKTWESLEGETRGGQI